MVGLSVKHQAFADYYIELGNAERAAVKAGYSETYARAQSYKLLANVGIKSYIDERLESLKDKRIADQEEILLLLTEIARGNTTGTSLVGIGGGAQRVDQLPPSVSERTKAAELLGKRYAMWTEKQDVTVTGAVQFIDDIGGDEDAT